MTRSMISAALVAVMSLGWMTSPANAIGMLLPAIQKVRESAARLNADTDGDGIADAFVWFGEVETADGKPLPVLMVIANQDFYYQEFAELRTEGRGEDSVLVASGPGFQGRLDLRDKEGKYVGAICHGVSVLAWARVDGQSVPQGKLYVATDTGVYSAIVFVGGWGSSMYQYDFPGDYRN